MSWRGVALNLAGYNWEVGRGAVSQWWSGWVSERAGGHCSFTIVMLSCPLKMSIRRVEQGCKRKLSRSVFKESFLA